MSDEKLKSAIEQSNRELGSKGRVFLRPSGTEPLIRLLVECDDAKTLDLLTERYTSLIRSL